MSFLARQLEDPIRFKWVKFWCYFGLAVVAAAEIVLPLLVHSGEHHFWFEGWPAWGSFYGLISCVAIIVLSKLIGKVGLMRPENYYDD